MQISQRERKRHLENQIKQQSLMLIHKQTGMMMMMIAIERLIITGTLRRKTVVMLMMTMTMKMSNQKYSMIYMSKVRRNVAVT